MSCPARSSGLLLYPRPHLFLRKGGEGRCLFTDEFRSFLGLTVQESPVVCVVCNKKIPLLTFTSKIGVESVIQDICRPFVYDIGPAYNVSCKVCGGPLRSSSLREESGRAYEVGDPDGCTTVPLTTPWVPP